ncbi:protein of unknown function DUF558 [Thermosinus carboxydivorans Nor1]|uniref:Ribosomal RNA small subunit methyltransferase E n=1 Tax=Thermosinus carboxydivorans Nor1 TaxID=401526 RepID=A1HR13_9FIRM|nr:16S rRNA (uracil(1498)-N(3))-methyltransferase [Thermosinus carboxydivorans]EAX47521.1 protein of unknown function DUF558 [Thermosinus carboxydivorans Nor1]
MRRFFFPGPLASEMIITGDDGHHIARVLRLKPGDYIIVAGQDGQACKAEIISVDGSSVKVACRQALTESNEPPVEVWLAQGLPKGDKMDFIIQKAVELGVTRILPIETAYTVVRYDAGKKAARRERWQKIAYEAAKQCGRAAVPEVASVQTFSSLLKMTLPETVIMLYEGQPACGLKQALRMTPSESYLLLIGPEGGFSPDEVLLCRQRGAQIVTMGPRILRTETAALAALTAVLYERGDLGGT